MHSDTADVVEAVTWQVGWFRLEHPVLALSVSVCDDVYDSYVCDTPRLVCNISRASLRPFGADHIRAC